jgi:hypothetical protein
MKQVISEYETQAADRPFRIVARKHPNSILRKKLDLDSFGKECAAEQSTLKPTTW